ncbi:unnamed protein product, partial [Enterobius vermicularis]|uniref:50S ribosomal protein L18e n=1 Tax=Enterobius vermicularis TaxID=51028 RepID=A0A0N4V8G7_ENTVE
MRLLTTRRKRFRPLSPKRHCEISYRTIFGQRKRIRQVPLSVNWRSKDILERDVCALVALRIFTGDEGRVVRRRSRGVG